MKKIQNSFNNISLLQLTLTVLFVVSLLVSNVITAKQVLLPFDIVMTGAVIVFPITYILSDLFSEIYGYRWSRLTCYLAFAMNVFMVLIFTIVIESPAPSYWMNQEAFQTVLGSTPRVLFASLTAFVIGDLVNDRVFRRFNFQCPHCFSPSYHSGITSLRNSSRHSSQIYPSFMYTASLCCIGLSHSEHIGSLSSSSSLSESYLWKSLTGSSV